MTSYGVLQVTVLVFAALATLYYNILHYATLDYTIMCLCVACLKNSNKH